MARMKSFGVLGGASAESTLLFYGEIISRLEENGATFFSDFPYMSILNVPFPDDINYIEDRDCMLNMAIFNIKMFNKQPLDFIVIPCNTLHMYYDDLSSYTNIPIIDMVSLVKNRVINECHSKVLLFGTSPLVNSGIYVSDKYDLILPNYFEQKSINNIIHNLCIGHFRDSYATTLRDIINRYSPCGVIMGCTELSFIRFFDIPVSYSLDILIDKTLELIL